MIQLCVLDVNLRGQGRFNSAATEMKMWNAINTNGPLIKAVGEIHLDRSWRVDLKKTCFNVNGRRSTASTAVTKQLNWGKSDPVYTDSAKTANLAKGRLEKMLFWHDTTVFLMRHHTCWNQLEIQTILIVIFLSDDCVLSINSRKCATARVVFLPHVLHLQGISMCGHIETPTETPKELNSDAVTECNYMLGRWGMQGNRSC